MRRRPPNQAIETRGRRSCAIAERRCGFSLVELLVVIAVALILTGLLLPAMSQIRENAHRVVCSSNLRQQGLATFMYEKDYGGVPFSYSLAVDKKPWELMSAHRGEDAANWDGMGLVYYYGYCKSPSCFYCPSHHGVHTFERYERLWFEYETVYAHTDHSETGAGSDPAHPGDDPDEPADQFGRAIFTNYHYAGHLDWADDSKKRMLDRGEPWVLATDGMREKQDFNHVVGWNALLNDGSVSWNDDTKGILESLPEGALTSTEAAAYRGIWGRLH